MTKKVALLINPEEMNYVHNVTKLLEPTFQKVVVIPIAPTQDLLQKLLAKFARSGITTAVVAERNTLHALFGSSVLEDYYGTFHNEHNIDWLVIPPLPHWHTVAYGKHLIERYISKLTKPNNWIELPEFTYKLYNNLEAHDTWEAEIAAKLSAASAVAIDIETSSTFVDGTYNPKITCVGFCFITLRPSLELTTVCIPIKSWVQYLLVKKICEHPIPKIFQNGKYDLSYLYLWKIHTKSYYFDTLNLAHSHYSELPKALDVIGAYYLRRITYWKDDNSYIDELAHYRYNARDVYTTAAVFLAQLSELPDWAKRNYKIQFPKELVCLSMSLSGLPINRATLEKQLQEARSLKVNLLARLERFTYPGFNPASPKQVFTALTTWAKFLKVKPPEDTNEKNLKVLAVAHPWLDIFIRLLLDYREHSKYISNYLEVKLLHNRLFYTIETAATDTGRFASRASSFSYIDRIKRNNKPEWVNFGTQIQNIPPRFKECVEAPDGWCFAEIDYSQSEARCTAYLAQDPKLIDAVENSPDFHCTNASLFFGIPFEELFDVKTDKKLNKEIRDLAKRVNHGANYNMQAQVLLLTMGLPNVQKAKALLKLPEKWQPIEVTEYLLKCFDATYPKVRNDYYESVRRTIQTTGKLVSPLGWTRHCFGNPLKNKQHLNAYVAHGPQNLSVQILNIGMVKVFNELCDNTFALLAQIHDSLLFLYKDTESNRQKVAKAKEFLTVPVMVNGMTMVIPPSVSMGKQIWADLKD